MQPKELEETERSKERDTAAVFYAFHILPRKDANQIDPEHGNGDRVILVQPENKRC